MLYLRKKKPIDYHWRSLLPSRGSLRRSICNSQERMYIPPFTISAEAINLIAEISGLIERYAIRLEQEDGLRLRKVNRIKTIHSSLAIEGNKLSEDQVRDIIDGKNVVAPIKEIQEVKNAIKTYEMYPSLDAFKERDWAVRTVHRLYAERNLQDTKVTPRGTIAR